MARATINLESGGKVTVEGTPQEIHELLSLYSKQTNSGSQSLPKPKSRRREKTSEHENPSKNDGEINLTDLVHAIRDSEDAELIEKNILDRTSAVDKVLLPLYVAHHLDSKMRLTTGQIATITKELGVPVAVSNVSTKLSGAASKYVIPDKVRKNGVATGYLISRRGITYLKSVITGKE
jgi:hypothetical protein